MYICNYNQHIFICTYMLLCPWNHTLTHTWPGIITPQELLSIRNNINEAINQTKQRLLEAVRTRSASPSKLLLLLKFPTEGTIELAKAAEIFAEAIARIESNSSLNVSSVHSKCKHSTCILPLTCLYYWLVHMSHVIATLYSYLSQGMLDHFSTRMTTSPLLCSSLPN